MITLADIIAWIIVHRKRSSFRGLSYRELLMLLSEKANKDQMLLILGGDSIAGIVIYTPDNEKKELFIDDILTTEKGVVKEMMKICMAKFPNYFITGKHRSERIRLFKDQEKLTRRL